MIPLLLFVESSLRILVFIMFETVHSASRGQDTLLYGKICMYITETYCRKRGAIGLWVQGNRVRNGSEC